jgi:class 3 adenylate cyclase
MKKCFSLVFTILIFAQFAFAIPKESPYKKVTTLDGAWDFYWNQLITMPDEGASKETEAVPSTWKHDKYGYGTYIKKIDNLEPGTTYGFLIYESPGTSSAAYVNGEYLSACGEVSSSAGGRAATEPWLVRFSADRDGKAVIAIQVSNWVYRKAGMWSTVYFGEYDAVRRQFNWRIAFSAIVLGLMLFLFIVNIVLFLLNHERKDSLLFAIIALLMSSRLLTAEFSLLVLLYPHFPFAVARQLEYIPIWAGISTFFYLLDTLFPELKINTGVHKFFPIIALAAGVVSLFLPLSISNYFVTPFIAMAFIIMLWIVYCSLRRYGQVSQNRKFQLNFLFVILLFVVIGLFLAWIVSLVGLSFKYSVVPVIFMVFSVLQFLVMSYSQSYLYNSRIKKSQELQRLNEAYERFIPKEFLRTLNKQKVSDVKLGDNVESDMTIMFFTIKTSGDMESQFEKLSLFAEKAVDVISDNHGYLSKFINKGIMALFPNSPNDAVNAAFDLRDQAMSCGIPGVGCGIHYGKMIVGTIGEENRLDDTVISDTVNTASRIMEYACLAELSIVVSQVIVDAIKSNDSYIQFSELGEIMVKGKKEPVQMYSCEEQGVTPAVEKRWGEK